MNARRHIAIALALAVATVVGTGTVIANSADVQRTSPGPHASAEHGRYLVRAGDCMSCHTADNGAPFAGSAITLPERMT